MGRLQLAHYGFQKFAAVPVLVFNELFTSFKSGLHTSNLCWQDRVDKLKLVCVNDTTTCWQTVGEKLARIEISSIFRQQFANMLFRSHTPI